MGNMTGLCILFFLNHSLKSLTRYSILYEYLVNDFNEWLRKNKIQRPVILFSDFHDTRNNYHLAKRMNELSIAVICLYPNSTHILQPLDVSCFRPLKNEWRKAMNKFSRNNSRLLEKDRKKVTPNDTTA